MLHILSVQGCLWVGTSEINTGDLVPVKAVAKWARVHMAGTEGGITTVFQMTHRKRVPRDVPFHSLSRPTAKSNMTRF